MSLSPLGSGPRPPGAAPRFSASAGIRGADIPEFRSPTPGRHHPATCELWQSTEVEPQSGSPREHVTVGRVEVVDSRPARRGSRAAIPQLVVQRVASDRAARGSDLDRRSAEAGTVGEAHLQPLQASIGAAQAIAPGNAGRQVFPAYSTFTGTRITSPSRTRTFSVVSPVSVMCCTSMVRVSGSPSVSRYS